ncbi:hypothetical protein [Pseudomonas sp. AA-38]|uniref:hypothetical protein n=1 Tax=Pseudomonas sp. AA-38 TaxID=3028807 RepID=UPI0023F7AE0D|nr:hypothetical protein [Pseudomonas sp. AA-38]
MDLAITFTSPGNGGREHPPDLRNGLYRPHIVVDGRPRDEYLGVLFMGCSVAPEFGVEVLVTVRLPYEQVDYSPLKVGASFVIKEGGREVGSGRVVKL